MTSQDPLAHQWQPKLTYSPVDLQERLYWYVAVLNPSKYDPTGIHDGDTFNVVVDLGGYLYTHKAIRVANINAPELADKGTADNPYPGKAARDWAEAWFKQHCPDGQFYIHTHVDPSDKYGRFLAMCYAPDGACFNDDIVAAGHAVPFEVEQY